MIGGRPRRCPTALQNGRAPWKSTWIIFGCWLACTSIRDCVAKSTHRNVVQQTLLIAQEKFGQFRGQTHAELASWLRAILARTLGAGTRGGSTGTSRSGLGRLKTRSINPPARLEAWLVKDQSTPGRRTIKAEHLMLLASSLASLPADQRTALELHHCEGLTVPEVARRMDKTVASVTGLLYRGGKALRTRMGEAR